MAHRAVKSLLSRIFSWGLRAHAGDEAANFVGAIGGQDLYTTKPMLYKDY